MKTLLIAVILLITGLFKCGGNDGSDIAAGCNVKATVVDLTGKLDGCGVMLELEDGTYLTPVKHVYIQAPKRKDDPLYYFELVPGDKLMLGYRDENTPSTCMNGKSVFLTCITKMN